VQYKLKERVSCVGYLPGDLLAILISVSRDEFPKLSDVALHEHLVALFDELFVVHFRDPPFFGAK
jgi:hypothetical protein